MFYQDRLERFIAAIHTPRNLRRVFNNFCYYFWGHWTETCNIGKDFFVF